MNERIASGFIDVNAAGSEFDISNPYQEVKNTGAGQHALNTLTSTAV